MIRHLGRHNFPTPNPRRRGDTRFIPTNLTAETAQTKKKKKKTKNQKTKNKTQSSQLAIERQLDRSPKAVPKELHPAMNHSTSTESLHTESFTPQRAQHHNIKQSSISKPDRATHTHRHTRSSGRWK
uniref:Uncharacterized protein n=1 Tax=Physcomitrium patens TaxID=3218 RepID=A0A2K1IYA2_PHYPA|nr:hypothetical protein PHYPA_024070 [Physcomitrium patens]